MRLPGFLARPLFDLIYPIVRKQEGGQIPPIKRIVRPPDNSRRCSFDTLLDAAFASAHPPSLMAYDLPYPKSEFLTYACDWRGLVAHGSPQPDLDRLEPIRTSTDSSEFGNRKQIFASPDAIWAMWFAILDKSKYNSTRNGCVRVGLGPGRCKYYHFELPASAQTDPPFADGMIYLCRASDFPYKHPYRLLDFFNAEIEEWGSTQLIVPLAKLTVGPNDFPYLDQVQFSL